MLTSQRQMTIDHLLLSAHFPSLFSWRKALVELAKLCRVVLVAQAQAPHGSEQHKAQLLGIILSTVCLFQAAAAATWLFCSRKPHRGKPCQQRAEEDTNQPFRFRKKTIYANEKFFHVIKYPLSNTFAGCTLICWWWPHNSLPVETIESTVLENCFDESQVCQFGFYRKSPRKPLSYDRAGLFRMYECSFHSSHLSQVLRTETSMRNMYTIYQLLQNGDENASGVLVMYQQNTFSHK